MELRLLLVYLRSVLAHGRYLLVSALGTLGGIATIKGEFPIPRWLWGIVIAAGILGAQFRAYCDVTAELATVRARLRELDTVEAKRAFIDEALEESRAFKSEVDAEEFAEDLVWFKHQGRIVGDVAHWENSLRATLRRAFAPGNDRLFDSNDEGDADTPVDSTRDTFSAYVSRREARLREIREKL